MEVDTTEAPSEPTEPVTNCSMDTEPTLSTLETPAEKSEENAEPEKTDEKPTEPAETPAQTEEPVEESNEKQEEQIEEKPIVEIPEKPPEIEADNSVPEIAKDAELITAAQEEIKKLDLFVCGKCHTVYNFIEEFQCHKNEECTEATQIKNSLENEGKPQVWGFCLWKAQQLKLLKEGETAPTSWSIYQNWCKLKPLDKEAWIVAGESLQFNSKMGNAKLNEVRSSVDKDPLALDEENSIIEGEGGGNAADIMKKNIVKPVKLNNDVTILPSTKNGDSNKAYKILKESIRQECTVEKIVAKRFNPRRKTFEYQIKWENYDSSENTWEPPGNLAGCKSMVEEFEENLKKQKAEQKLNGTPKGRGRPRLSASAPKQYVPAISTANLIPTNESTPGRPQRASKQKALNQVKSWCGNISDTDDGGVKRPYDDDDSDDSFEKKMKLEDYSDSDDEKPKYSLKRITKPAPTTPQTVSIINNGMGNKIPQNVLIPDANGVVRINQKQLPSLSTGVYIMSKTAGIIKLDSTTSKVATSGGQTIVKVAPKIGQTQIKIVKKEGSTTNKIIQMSPKLNVPTKTYKPVITKIKRNEPEKDKPKVTAKPKDDLKAVLQQPLVEEDSDDGLPELEFPTDLPLPEPDSPPGDFVLDPTTGKIVGQDYPEQDKPVVTNEIGESSLENIVKLAAADITEEDLKTEPTIISAITPVGLSNISEDDKTDLILPSTSMDTNDDIETDNSILNKALTNSNILQKTLVSPRPKIQQQRILNHSVAPRTHTINPLIRHTNPNLIRTKPTAPRPKFNIASTITKVTDTVVRKVYSKASAVSPNNIRTKIGHTSVYRNIGSVNKPQPRLTQSGANVNVYKASPRKEILQSPTKPKSVISMPSLIGDDEPVIASTSGQSTTSAAASVAETPAATGDTDLSSFTLTDNENPIFITGDDGTVYQVAGQNEQGQTILITQGSDGQQQCLLVTNDSSAEESQPSEDSAEVPKDEPDVTDPLSIKTEADGSDQVVAQVVRAEPPSPGGTHKVVVMLPDGNLMVTQVSPEEYASLELE